MNLRISNLKIILGDLNSRKTSTSQYKFDLLHFPIISRDLTFKLKNNNITLYNK